MLSYMDYRHSTHHVYLLNYHLIWCPKRRRNILIDNVKRRLHSIFPDAAKERQYEIVAPEIMPDHLHLASTAGNVSNAVVKQYIEQQSKK